MNFMSEMVRLLSQNKVDELFAYVEENDFPADVYIFESANELRQLKHRLLLYLADCQKLVEDSDLLPDEFIREMKDALLAVLALYMDLQLVVALNIQELISAWDENAEGLKQLEEKLKTMMRLHRRNATVKQSHAIRDAMIHELARESGMPSRNKQADHVYENWDDTDLGEFNRLSRDRIRKILSC